MIQINVHKATGRDTGDMLNIKPETVCHIIFKDRQLQSGVPATVSDDDVWAPSQDPINEANLDTDNVRNESTANPVYDELATFIGELPDDDQCELIALAWLGRGDGSKNDWPSLVKLARERRTTHTYEYLFGMPLLSDYLVEALAMFDIACEAFENEHH